MTIHQTRLAFDRERIPPDAAMATVIHHHAVLAASKLLTGIHELAPAHITFATDTLLHFYIYAASFLWTVSMLKDKAESRRVIDVTRRRNRQRNRLMCLA